MNNESNNNAIKEKVLEAIKSGRIAMRPKWHFVLKTGLMVVGGIILLLTLLYLASFIIFALRKTGVLFVPVFGFRGWFAFLISFPWFLIFLSLIFVVILEILVRRYAFAYRRPLLYSILGIVFIAVAGSFAADKISLHDVLFRYAEEHHLPFAGGFYREFGFERLRNIHLGNIDKITADGFMIKNRRGEILRIVVNPETRFPLGTDFVEGDTVAIFGDRKDDTVEAVGVRKVDDDFAPSKQTPGARHRFMIAP